MYRSRLLESQDMRDIYISTSTTSTTSTALPDKAKTVGVAVEVKSQLLPAEPETPTDSSLSLGLGYRYVADAATLRSVLPDLAAAKVAGLDTETTGLDPHNDRLRLIQIATETATHLIDCFKVDPAPLADWLRGPTVKVLHNTKFDIQFLLANGLETENVFDTMIADQLLTAGTGRPMRGLAALAKEYLSIDVPKDEQKSDWAGDLTDNQLIYAARDAVVTLSLHPILHRNLAKAGLRRVAKIENAAVLAVAWLEFAGCPFDTEAWRKLADEALLHQIRAKERLDSLVPSEGTLPGMPAETPNWGSPKQARESLRKVGIVVERTDAEILSEYAGHPLVDALIEYREAERRTGTYGLGFLSAINRKTSRIHGDWRQIGSVAGRMACQSPNLQNLPRDPRYRACFAAPNGRALVKCDFSQLELRLAAEISEDTALIEAYQHGMDVHTLTAKNVLGADEVTKAQRQMAKAINFGLIYGMGPSTLQRHALSSYRVELSTEDAKRFREAFFVAYPGLKRWHRRTGRMIEDGKTETRTLAHRRRLFPAPTGNEEADKKSRSYTEFINSPVQGSGADAIKAALALLWERRSEQPGAFPVLCIHDELVIECDRDKAPAVAEWLKKAMSDALACFLHKVPVGDLDVTIGKDWAMNPLPDESTLPKVGDVVYLVGPDGSVHNFMQPWRVDAIADDAEGPLARFSGMPYSNWPLAACRVAQLIARDTP